MIFEPETSARMANAVHPRFNTTIPEDTPYKMIIPILTQVMANNEDQTSFCFGAGRGETDSAGLRPSSSVITPTTMEQPIRDPCLPTIDTADLLRSRAVWKTSRPRVLDLRAV